MVLIDCKNKKCPFSASLIANVADPTDLMCNISFYLMTGTETFCAPDGTFHLNSYFKIVANSEEEREQKRICLREHFTEQKQNLTVFENVLDTNPIFEWQLSTENIMQLNSCIEILNNDFENTIELFDYGHILNKSRNRESSGNINEVWDRFISNRLEQYKPFLTNEQINEIAVEMTIDEIDEFNDPDRLRVLAHIARELKKSKQEKKCANCGYCEHRSGIVTIPKDKTNKSAGVVDLCFNCFGELKICKLDSAKFGIVSSYAWQLKNARIPYEGEFGPKCHDCDAKVGELHGYNCDLETCPDCGGQLMGCDCDPERYSYHNDK